MAAWVTLEESDSFNNPEEPVQAVTEGFPVVSGTVVEQAGERRFGTPRRRRSRTASDRNHGKVRIVYPQFDVAHSLSTPLALGTNNLMSGQILRRKSVTMTYFDFHVYYLGTTIHCLKAKMGFRKGSMEILSPLDGSSRGRVRRSRTGKYIFCDNKGGQVIDARITNYGVEAPVDMGVQVGNQRLESRKARWSEKMQSWVLDYQGLCDTASCKNVQLAPQDGPQTLAETCFLLGKQGDGSFKIYFRTPFSPLQAFATALVIFAGSS